MINGIFGVEDALIFEIEFIASDGSGLEIEAMFDSGFSGWLAVNDQDIDGFGWIKFDRKIMTTAQGSSFFDIYAGTIKLDGQEHHIPVHVGKNLTEVLLGRQWLETKPLFVNKPEGILTKRIISDFGLTEAVDGALKYHGAASNAILERISPAFHLLKNIKIKIVKFSNHHLFLGF